MDKRPSNFFVGCRQRYITTSREVKRWDATSRSPVYASFSATLKVGHDYGLLHCCCCCAVAAAAAAVRLLLLLCGCWFNTFNWHWWWVQDCVLVGCGVRTYQVVNSNQ
jgi:hypothetical protein